MRPSFDPAALVAVMTTGGWTFRGTTTVAGMTAAFAANGEVVTLGNLPADPVAEVLRAFNLFARSGHDALDGIGYILSCDTGDTRSELHFANPTLPHLIALERGMYFIARHIAGTASNGPLLDYLRIWERYRSPRL